MLLVLYSVKNTKLSKKCWIVPCLQFPSLCVDTRPLNPFNPSNPHNPHNRLRRHNKERSFNSARAHSTDYSPPPFFHLNPSTPKQDDQRHLLDRIANDSGYAVVITFVRVVKCIRKKNNIETRKKRKTSRGITFLLERPTECAYM